MKTLIIPALLLVALVGWRWNARTAGREESQKGRFIREACTPGLTVWDDDAYRWITLPPGVRPSPSQYTDDVVASLDDLTLAWDKPTFDPATDPQRAAGRARLLDAIRDHHTNTPEGD